jgi:uncharacterized peroxidase-related enzyme
MNLNQDASSMSYQVHDTGSAPESSRPLLEKAEGAFGFVPNILSIMAESPALLEAYMSLSEIFEKTDFDATEKQVVLLAVSHDNGCGYCLAAHSGIASMQKLPDDVIEAVVQGRKIDDDRLEALRAFTQRVVSTRGNPGSDDIDAFLKAGYSRRQLLDVIAGVGMKTLSNYTNHIAETPLDKQFGG